MMMKHSTRFACLAFAAAFALGGCHKDKVAQQDAESLPAPDAVFIGGHGGRLGELIDRIDAVLAPGGRVVINAVLDSSRHAFESAIARLGYRSLPALRLQVDAHNPIAVLAAEKPSVPIQEKRP